MVKFKFEYNHRLGIEIPKFYQAWEDLTKAEQQQVLYHWEVVRSHIPDRIKELEKEIHWRELQLQVEDNFEIFCQLSAEITDLASRIIDLNLWFHTQEELTTEKMHQ